MCCNNFNIPIISANPSQICAGASTQVCSSPGFANYLWNTSETSQCITTHQAGNYFVTVTDNNGCSAVSNHLAITNYPIPPVSMSVNGDTLTAYDAASYQWYLNGNPISGATSNLYIAIQSGSYTVEITDSNGCNTTSNAVIISGIKEIASQDEISVNLFPNPANTQLYIQCENFYPQQLILYNVNGEKISEQKYTPQLDVSALARGIYFIALKNAETTVRKKFVKM